MPRLSIVIPTFNASSSIERCLRSIINQTFTDYEVLIQDGGSVDKTIELIKHIHQTNTGSQIKLYQEDDSGIYDAMNRAIHRASGEWLYFLGSDDELSEPNVLSRVMRIQDAAPADVLYGNVKVIGNAKWAMDGAVYDGPFNLEKVLTKNICHQAIFYRTDFFRKIGSYNPRYVVCADWDLNMRCWAKTTFRYVDLIVAKFHAGGMSTQDRCDECFATEVAGNVLQYFNLSIFDPLINTPTFVGYSDIVNMQASRRLSRYSLGRSLKTLARKVIATRTR